MPPAAQKRGMRYMAASGDKTLHLGLKDSKFAFNKGSKIKQRGRSEQSAAD